MFTPKDRRNLRWFWDGYLKEKSLKLTGVLLLVVSQGLVYQQFLSLTDQSLRIIFERGALSDLVLDLPDGVLRFLLPWDYFVSGATAVGPDCLKRGYEAAHGID